MEIKFKQRKVTKNTIVFEEILASDSDMPKIGTVYIQKTALAELGYKEGNMIIITLEEEK